MVSGARAPELSGFVAHAVSRWQEKSHVTSEAESFLWWQHWPVEPTFPGSPVLWGSSTQTREWMAVRYSRVCQPSLNMVEARRPPCASWIPDPQNLQVEEKASVILCLCMWEICLLCNAKQVNEKKWGKVEWKARSTKDSVGGGLGRKWKRAKEGGWGRSACWAAVVPWVIDHGSVWGVCVLHFSSVFLVWGPQDKNLGRCCFKAAISCLN